MLPFRGGYSDSKQVPQKELKEIFDGDTLPVRRREQGRSKVKSRGEASHADRRSSANQDFGAGNQGSQSPSSATRTHGPEAPKPSRPHAGGGHHQQTAQSQLASTYTQHMPSAMKKRHRDPPPPDGPPHHHRGHKASRGATSNPTSQQQLRVQFKPDHHDDRPHPLLYRSSGIPMRATKSAQAPAMGSDAPLTSYPRSHTHAMQQRSASNGRVQHHQVGPRPGHAYQGVHVGGASQRLGFQHGGYGHGKNNDMAIGSLV